MITLLKSSNQSPKSEVIMQEQRAVDMQQQVAVTGKQITGFIPSADAANAAVKVISEDGTVGYLVGKDAFAKQSSIHLRQSMIQRNSAMGDVSEADMLAGAISASSLVFGNEMVGFASATMELMSGRSIIGKKRRFVINKEIETHPAGVSSVFTHELLACLDEDAYNEQAEKYEYKENIFVIDFDEARSDYAWNLQDDEPFSVTYKGKSYMICM